MANHQQSGEPVEVRDRLSALVVETVRDLRRRRQPITINTVRSYLENRADLPRSLDAASAAIDRAEPNAASPGAPAMEELVKTLNDQKARLLREVAVLEDQQQHLWEFTTGALLTLVTWLDASTTHMPLSAAVKGFKTQLKDAGAPAEVEASFLALKERVLKEDPEGWGARNDSAEAKFPFGQWFTGGKKATGLQEAAESEDWPSTLRELLDGFLGTLEPLLPKSAAEEMTAVRELIAACRAYQQLRSLREALLRLGDSWVRGLHGERDQFARLIREIEQNLRAMEQHIVDSLGEARAMTRSNSDFALRMNQGMEEMSSSMETSQSFEELREVVVSKLAFLRQALEAKHRDDEQRLRRAGERMNDLQRNMIQMREEINQAQEQSRQLEEQLQRDTLTGALSRRGYEERMAQEFERYRRYRHKVSVIVFDLDHFKRVNDNYGHQMGDKCLKVIAHYIQPVIRKSDALARYGGDEFVLILPGIDAQEARRVAEKIRRLVEEIRFLYEGERILLTLSMGVAEAGAGDATAEHLFQRADQALYAAKQAGRNRVKVAGE